MGDKVDGTLLIIGGAEDKENKCEILKGFLALSKAEESMIVVLTTATQLPESVGQEYLKVFKKLGAAQVEILDIDNRQKANRKEVAEMIRKAKGIFFTGGDQLRITATLGGTRANEAIHQAYLNGAIIAGTSAGASCMSSNMIVEGDSDQAAKLNTIKMAPGLGLVHEVVIDQHFAQRGRIGRLLSAVAHNPYILGIGIDEDTAIIIRPDGKLQVIGSQTVTFIDAKQISYSNVSETAPGQALAIEGVKLHVLPRGHEFDLLERLPIRKEEGKGDTNGHH